MLTRVDVRVYWDFIAPGIWEIKNHSDPEWKPEDIYAALLNNVAELYIDIDEDPCESFIILQEKPNIFTPTKSFLIWIAYDKRGGAASKYMAHLEKMAKERGCNKIEFWTPHRRLAQALESIDYQTKLYVVEKDIK